jgi:hypothetical protein
MERLKGRPAGYKADLMELADILSEELDKFID